MTTIRIIFGTLLILCFNNIAYAQDTAEIPQAEAEEEMTIDIEGEATSGIDIEREVVSDTGFDFDKSLAQNHEEHYKNLPFNALRPLYQDPNYRNVTMLYWKTGRLDAEKDDHVDAYLLLMQCKNVKKLYYNDFKWDQLRKVSRTYLKDNKEKFGRRFKFIQPLKLGAYDFKEEGFKVDASYLYKNAKRIRISNNQVNRGDFCVNAPFIRSYIKEAPYNIVLSIKNPFSFDMLPMPRELSEMYLQYINQKSMGKNAYLVFYVTLNLYKDTVFNINVSGQYMNEYSGQVDYIEVFADQERKRLLYSRDYR